MITSQSLFDLVPQIKIILFEAGEIVVSEWKDITAEKKGTQGDVVTKVDRMVESFISERLKKLEVTDNIYGEEFGGVVNGYSWIIDPIDGTKDYVGKMPSFTIQIALVKDTDAIAGFIYNPVSAQLFYGINGMGAYLNDQRLSVMKETELSEAVIDLDFGGQEELFFKMEIFRVIAKNAYRVRISGGRFAPFLTTGGIHAFVILNPSTKIVDQAPRRIIFEEAGFVVKDILLDGKKITIAAKQRLLTTLLGLLQI